MTEFTLIIGNKNYSSWSLRPWLVLKHLGIEFTEIRIPLYTPTAKQEILRYSPNGKVPALLHKDLSVWESLSICEYLAECFPEANLWPIDRQARAIARSVSQEMHAGFANLRQHMSMNCRARLPGKGRQPGVAEDIQRIVSIWQDCRQKFESGGDFLFGHFTIADAMFAPVVSRFITYSVELDPVSSVYANTIWSLPAMQDWVKDAIAETERIEQYEF
ncbi:glutathione S-transferase family protein [Aerosakkonema funiforme]|uniref:Glutathione S-transferase family protein n=2 Tax=Oscillatoriophycideae TaxID=1301283 RepID=A0A926ZGC8_9CYAN|nr:glutathione S-transferase family protein [Aerosakkonema funiforme]MBD2182063.1 glutathione S-transferase family protein [Aerosakkonema funiforme FACHB-1375]